MNNKITFMLLERKPQYSKTKAPGKCMSLLELSHEDVAKAYIVIVTVTVIVIMLLQVKQMLAESAPQRAPSCTFLYKTEALTNSPFGWKK